MRLDLKTGKYQRIDPFKFLPQGHEHAPYGMAADGKNNLYFMDFGDQNIGRVDAETGAVTIFPTPTPNSRPRRTMLDDQGRLWFAEFAANKLAMFDTKAETFKEWDVPTPYTYPYDVFCDKRRRIMERRHGERSRVLRFDPQSGPSVEYLLPRPANIRRVFVDNSTDPVEVLGRQQSRRRNLAPRTVRLGPWRYALRRKLREQSMNKSFHALLRRS